MPQDLAAARRLYDRLSPIYDWLSNASERVPRERGLELLAARRGERVLELGFGTGSALAALGRAVGPEGRVCGLDLSPGMARVAGRRLQRAGLRSRVGLCVGAAPPLPFCGGTFDGVFLSFTLELFPDEVIPELLGEIARVLVPGGRLAAVAMSVPTPGRRARPLERVYAWLHGRFPGLVDCRPIDLEHELARGGFRVVAAERLSMASLGVRVALASPPP